MDISKRCMNIPCLYLVKLDKNELLGRKFSIIVRKFNEYGSVMNEPLAQWFFVNDYSEILYNKHKIKIE